MSEPENFQLNGNLKAWIKSYIEVIQWLKPYVKTKKSYELHTAVKNVHSQSKISYVAKVTPVVKF